MAPVPAVCGRKPGGCGVLGQAACRQPGHALRSALRRGVRRRGGHLLLERQVRVGLHGTLAVPLAQHDTLVLQEGHVPDRLACVAELPQEAPGACVPELHHAVGAAGDQEAVVHLERRDAAVVCAQPIQALERVEVKHDHAAVAAARGEDPVVQLQLRHHVRVSLEHGEVCPGGRVPHPHRGVRGPRDHVAPVERDRVHLEVVPLEQVQAPPRVHVPDPARVVVAAARHAVSRRVETADRVLVAREHVPCGARLEVPHAERAVAGAGHGHGPALEHLQAAHRAGVPVEHELAGPRAQVPHAERPVRAGAHQFGVGIAPAAHRGAPGLVAAAVVEERLERLGPHGQRAAGARRAQHGALARVAEGLKQAVRRARHRRMRRSERCARRRLAGRAACAAFAPLVAPGAADQHEAPHPAAVPLEHMHQLAGARREHVDIGVGHGHHNVLLLHGAERKRKAPVRVRVRVGRRHGHVAREQPPAAQPVGLGHVRQLEEGAEAEELGQRARRHRLL